MVKQPTPKNAVKLIREAFEQRAASISVKDAYALLAQLHGYRDWPTAKAMLEAQATSEHLAKEPKFAHVDEDIEGWPTWVFANKGNNPDEDFYVYRYGTMLEDFVSNGRAFCLVNDAGHQFITMDSNLMEGINLPLSEAFVGDAILCEYWDADEYGFPACANEREAHEFLKQELGWGYRALPGGRSIVEVTSASRNDDGMVEWWVQARVHPQVHQRLLKATANFEWRALFEDQLKSQSAKELFSRGNRANVVDAPTLGDKALGVLFNELVLWFENVGDYSFQDVLRVLNSYSREKPAVAILPPGFELCKGVAEASDAGSLVNVLREAIDSAKKVFAA